MKNNSLSNVFYKIRRGFWNYPDKLFTGKESVSQSFKRFYIESLPTSNILVSIISSLLLVTFITSSINALIYRKDTTFIEGVVMGVDENGQVLKINRINPLINSNVQLEKDLSEILYDSLIKIDQSGNAKPELADFFTIEKGKRYQFRLKADLYWSDGVKITTDDVVKTFELVKTLDSQSNTSNIYSRAANKIDIVKSQDDDRTFEFVVKGDNVIPGFFEAISFKILPAHLISDMNVNNITESDPILNRNPVGSGPYKISIYGENSLDLTINDYYYGKKPEIKMLRFKMFASEQAASDALLSGQVHGLSGISNDIINADSDQYNINKIISNTIYNQYWSLYLNFSDRSPKVFKELKFRQAVNMAINKDKIIQNSKGLFDLASGPIPPSSFAYLASAKVEYNPEGAKKLLDELGYLVPAEGGTRIKGTDNLDFDMVLIDNKDRESTAFQIKSDLSQVGININIVNKSLDAVVNEYIIPRNYELLLYGVQTFIDPDRYELFDSTQIAHPGLNISGYISSDKRTQIVNGKATKVSSVDDDLEDGRRLTDETDRRKKYEDFQKVIYAETPQIFLYYPKEVYLVNKRVLGIDIKSINEISQRFDSISDWQLE